MNAVIKNPNAFVTLLVNGEFFTIISVESNACTDPDKPVFIFLNVTHIIRRKSVFFIDRSEKKVGKRLGEHHSDVAVYNRNQDEPSLSEFLFYKKNMDCFPFHIVG